MYYCKVEITDFKRIGWDEEDESVDYIELYGKKKKDLLNKIEQVKKEHELVYRGDFGIILRSVTVRPFEIQKLSQKDIINHICS